MKLPMHLHSESMPDDPQLKAYLYGPVVLAGDLGADGLTQAHIIGPNLRVGAANVEQYGSALAAQNSAPPLPEIKVPSFEESADDLGSWIKPSEAPLTFRTTGQKTNVDLKPLNGLFDRRYNVYWRMT